MKKAIALVLVLILAAAVCASCAGKEKAGKQEPVNTESVNVTPKVNTAIRYEVINNCGERVTEITIGDSTGSLSMSLSEKGGWAVGDHDTVTIVPEGDVWFYYRTESERQFRITLPEPFNDATITILPSEEGGMRLDYDSGPTPENHL